MEKSNNLKYTAIKTIGDEEITVKIRLNDECKNGHQDFAITGDIYKAGRPHTDRNFLAGGCIHDTIEKYFPEYIPFIKLHLCDYNGVPTYAAANGFYHLKNGFNSKQTGEPFKVEYCNYYRVSPEQFDILNTAETETQYAIYLIDLGILDQWKKEATAAIKTLELLTGQTFVNDSTKTNFSRPGDKDIKEEKERQASGYYNKEAKEAREQEKQNKLLQGLKDDFDKELQEKINFITIEFEAKKEVLLKGGSRALDNCIFYNNTKELAFNWRSYDNLPIEYLNTLISSLVLPTGVVAKISANK